MPETEKDSEDAAAAKPKRSKLKLIIIAVGALAIVGGAGYAGLRFFRPHADAHAAAPPPKPPVFVDLPEVLVNLSGGNADRTQYLKVKVVLELADQQIMTQVQPVMPRVIDLFQTYLRELRPSDLEGSAGLYRLREELTRRVNTAIAPGRVNAVLFREILVQ